MAQVVRAVQGRLAGFGSLFYDPGTTHPHSEHDCPGPLFDFHRLAREISDYWWYPFDVVGASSAVPHREYRKFTEDTPTLEFFWDESEALRTARLTDGIHGPRSTPDTFVLQEHSPVYAMANGELVAARFPPVGAGVSMGFLLVRHEVYHQPVFAPLLFLPGIEVREGEIFYGVPPESVYTLYMHLGRPPGLSFDGVNDDNPDWLNRLIMRRTECTSGVDFYDGDPAHHGISAAQWNNRPPGVPRRATTLEGWRTDKDILDNFIDVLSTGGVAVAPRQVMTVPNKLLLGDFIGESGVIRSAGGPIRHGVRVETFSRSFEAPTFTILGSVGGWNPPAGQQGPFGLQFQSEWARSPTDAERAALVAQGVDPDQLGWWGVVLLRRSSTAPLIPPTGFPLTGSSSTIDRSSTRNGSTASPGPVSGPSSKSPMPPGPSSRLPVRRVRGRGGE